MDEEKLLPYMEESIDTASGEIISEQKEETLTKTSNSSVHVELSDLVSDVHSFHGETKVIQHGRRVQAKIKPKTPLERVFGRHNCYSEHYFTSGSGINESNRRNVLKEPSPFMRTDDENVYSYKVISEAWRDRQRRKELGLKFNERNNYKSRQQLDVLSRLFVEEPAVQTVKTILDIDPHFFTIVEGRPIVEKFNVRDYIESIRKVLRTRIVTGFREDDVLQIEENFIEEQRLIDKIKSQYQIFVDMFEEFLADDHMKSMNLLKESEREAAVSFQLYETFREMSKDFGALKSSVYNLEEKWRNCKMYQKFLYMVSPLPWRRQYDYYARPPPKKESPETAGADDEGLDLVVENFSTLFSRYQITSGGEVSFDEMINMFLEDCEIKEPPVLYFSEPEELMKVFRFSELQNLNALLHSEELAGPLENIKESMMQAQLKFDEEITTLNDMINNLEGDILWEEERAKSLEELARRLIDTSFRRLISAEEILNWYVFVEDVYESRIAPNDANLTACDMMRAIEIKYRDFLIKLDGLPQNKVHTAEMECYTEEERIMAIAEEASKKVLQIERMTKHLQRILEPPYVKPAGAKYTKYKGRAISKIDKQKHKHLDSGHEAVSSEETELLELFTDYCKHTDDPNSYELDDLIRSLVIIPDAKANHEKPDKPDK